MSYIPKVVTVPQGGSGVAALTAYSLIAGGTSTTNPVQSIASVGTTGQILKSNGAAVLPTFQTIPAFYAINPSSNNVANVTGDGSDYTCTFNQVISDLTGVFSGNTTFTAPVDGTYAFHAGIYIAQIGAAHTELRLQLIASSSASTINFWYGAGFNLAFNGLLCLTGSTCLRLAAGITVTMKLNVYNSTKTIDWVGSDLNANPPFFSGYLVSQ